MNNDSIRKDNKKALPKYLLIILLSAIFGGVIGLGAGIYGDSGQSAHLADVLVRCLIFIGPWGIPAGILVFLLPASMLYRKAKKQLALWDGEDEETANQIDRMEEKAIFLTSLMLLLSLLFFSIQIVYLPDRWLILFGVILFIVSMIWSTLLQQKLVDLIRKMNPEKKGSIYDVNFQKTWLNSCDEAERKLIGEGAYFAMQVTTMVSMLLWVLLIFAEIWFHTGLLPIMTVLFLTGVLQVSYYLKIVRLNKKEA